MKKVTNNKKVSKFYYKEEDELKPKKRIKIKRYSKPSIYDIYNDEEL